MERIKIINTNEVNTIKGDIITTNTLDKDMSYSIFNEITTK